jgi:hypothetical protein
VHCQFEKHDKKLLTGIYTNAAIELKNAAQLSIQKEAVVSFENKEYAFVKKSNNYYKMTDKLIRLKNARDNDLRIFFQIKLNCLILEKLSIFNGKPNS